MATDAAVAALVLAAAFAQGVTGFGFGLILMAVLPRLVPLQAAVATVAVVGLFVCVTLLWRYRRAVAWSAVARLLAGALLGLPLGVLALRDLDSGPAIRILGGLLVAFSLWSLRAGPPAAAREDKASAAWAYPSGFLGGLFGGAFGTGGPPVVIYATVRGWSPGRFRGVLQGFFGAANAVHLGLLGAADMLPREVVTRGLLMLPLVPLGVLLGAKCGDRLHPERFRLVVLVALLVMGLGYLVLGA